MNIKAVLKQLGLNNMAELEKRARQIERALSPEQRKELRKQFREKSKDETFRNLVEENYKEIQEDIDHG